MPAVRLYGRIFLSGSIFFGCAWHHFWHRGDIFVPAFIRSYGPGSAFSAAIGGVAVNYGVRRFLFYDPDLGQSELLGMRLFCWGMLLFLMVILSLAETSRPFYGPMQIVVLLC